MMNPYDEPIILSGKAAKDFEEYLNRPATEEQLKFLKESHEFYLSCCKKQSEGLNEK